MYKDQGRWHTRVYKNKTNGGIAYVVGSLHDIFRDETLEINSQKTLLLSTEGVCLEVW